MNTVVDKLNKPTTGQNIDSLIQELPAVCERWTTQDNWGLLFYSCKCPCREVSEQYNTVKPQWMIKVCDTMSLYEYYIEFCPVCVWYIHTDIPAHNIQDIAQLLSSGTCLSLYRHICYFLAYFSKKEVDLSNHQSACPH